MVSVVSIQGIVRHAAGHAGVVPCGFLAVLEVSARHAFNEGRNRDQD
jgi:hypothetical protein